MKTIKKIAAFLYSVLHQKTFYSDSKRINYIFKRHKKSNDIVVVFPAVTRKPFFNYIDTLKRIKANVLFLKDDFGPNNSSTYFFGDGGSELLFSLLDLLLDNLLLKSNIKNIYAIGSSKGGTISIFWSLVSKHSVSYVIAGGPQYHLGEYLFYHGGQKMLAGIMGESTKQSANRLDEICEQIITSSNNKINILFLTSSKEDKFHIKENKLFIDDLNQSGCIVFVTDGLYEGHSQLAKSYKTFLLGKLNELGIK